MSQSVEFQRFPEHWQVLPFLDAVKDVTSGNMKIPKGDYLDTGKYPIVDQGQSLFGGYIDDASYLAKVELPAIVFGDHTRAFKFIGDSFCLGADGAKILEPKVDLDKKFLYYYLKQLRIESAGYSRHYKFLKETLVPLPPLAEQKRIAAILDKADAIRRKRQQAIQLADDFLRSVFLDMFGDPVTNPKGWDLTTFRELITTWKPGVTIQPDDFTDAGFPVLHKGAVQRGGSLAFDSRKKTHTSIQFAEDNSKAIIDESYIAINLRDLVPTGPSIGLMCDLSRYGSKKYLLAYGAYGFRVNSGRVSPEYLVALTNHMGFRNKLIKISVGSTQIHIRKDDFFDLEIPFPNYEIQIKYQELVEKTRKSLLSNIGSFGRVDLFSSLSQKAFKGEL